MLFFAPVCWALGSILSRNLDMPDGLMSTAAIMLTGSMTSLMISLLSGESLAQAPDARAIAAFLYLVVFGSLIAFNAYTYLLRNAPTAVATSYAYVNPVMAVILGWLVAGESLGPMTLVAGGFILVAVVIINNSRGGQH